MGAGFALFFFSQALIEATSLVEALARHAPGLAYAGCSTAGEITPAGLEEGHVVAMLFPSASFTVASTMLTDISTAGMTHITVEVETLRQRLAAQERSHGQVNVFALCLIDGLSYAEEAVTSAIP